MFWINFDKILIFPFKISEYHWGAELMFNIKRINARVIQLASDLCSYTSSGFGGQLQWGEGEGGPGLQASVWAESRNSTEQRSSSDVTTLQHCSTAALHRCIRPQDNDDLSRFPLSSIFSKSRNSIHYPLILYIIRCIYSARLSSSIHFAWLPWSGPDIQLSSYTKTLPSNILVARSDWF